jgi:protocatechuate 3,4-dioxygenase beta subunit
MQNDDHQIGELLSRREALLILGATGGSLLLGCGPETAGRTASAAVPPGMCVVRPEQTEGPYFVDERLERSDIRSDPMDGAVKAGAPLLLAFHVSRLTGNRCTPLAGAYVDIWQCDAEGVYSDVTDRSFSTVGKRFLRGYQVTGQDGVARFTTIYPGWYPGRTVHIHFKIRTALDIEAYDFTSQLYFDDAFTDAVFAHEPYAARGPRGTRNEADGIFRRSGSQLLLSTVQKDAGYAADFQIGLQI